VVCESLSRRKQQAVVAKLPQQSRYAPQHCGIVIDDQDNVSLWQNRFPWPIGQRRFTFELKQFEPVKLRNADKVRYSLRSSYSGRSEFPIASWDNSNSKTIENCSGGLSVTGHTAQNPSPFRKGNEFCQGPHRFGQLARGSLIRNDAPP
jgi:hypothetical protein